MSASAVRYSTAPSPASSVAGGEGALPRVVVVGGGIAGLAAAARLAGV
ncbi:hypothetical protein G5C65_28270, partial [Streptomyces sp. SB3404]|nr:hypothetical protein [Streptomyces boncukensis]